MSSGLSSGTIETWQKLVIENIWQTTEREALMKDVIKLAAWELYDSVFCSPAAEMFIILLKICLLQGSQFHENGTFNC